MDNALAEPTFVTWIENGKEYRQISAPSKREILAEYAKKYGCVTFVETGTCEGDTIAAIGPMFEKVYSIELNTEYAMRACQRFKDFPNVAIREGDSAAILPKLLPALKEPVLFWLDAHGPNWIGPIRKELQAILDSKIKGVTLIDDMDYMPDAPNLPAEYGIARIIHVG